MAKANERVTVKCAPFKHVSSVTIYFETPSSKPSAKGTVEAGSTNI